MASSKMAGKSSASKRPPRAWRWALLLVWCELGCRPGAFDDLGSVGAASEAEAGLDAGSEPDGSGAGPDDAAGGESGQEEDVGSGPDDAAPGPEDAAEPLDAAGDDAAAPPADAAPPDAAITDALPPVDAGPTTVELPILSDRDDALWRVASGGLEEMLHFSAAEHGSAGYTIEVGVDGEQCRAGLRFALPIAPGARVLAASLRLQRVGSETEADPKASMRVQVYDASSVGPFDHAHMHQDPAEHASGGLWLGASVGAFHVGSSGDFTQSEDLSELVQHVVDRPDWIEDGYIGFVLTPDEMAGEQFAQFRDSAADANPPTLTVTFQGQ
jgi:hypothetical protein